MRDSPEPEEPLETLLTAVAARDRAAYRRLYARTSAKLFGVVLRIVKDRGIAEDVLQEAYLGIWRGAASYAAERARPMTWMITIARNRAIDAVRSRRETLLEPGDDGEDPIAAIPDPFDAARSFAERDALARCLDTLEELQRHCILLAYCEGWSREELAARTGRNVNTIKTWLHRGLASLKRCLGS